MKRMSYKNYAYLKALITREKERTTQDFRNACSFLPKSDENGLGNLQRLKVNDYAYKIFNDEYHGLTLLEEELHDAVASTYKDHPNPEMRKFWGLE